MTTTIIPKDVGEVKDVYRRDYRWSVEEGCEDYIKLNIGIKE